MSQIEHVHARQILDSRGNPTVEVGAEPALRRVGSRGGAVGRLDRRVRGDGAARRRRRLPRQGRDEGGRATSTGRSRPRCSGRDATNQAGIDRLLIELDGTPSKSRLGANAILAVSLAAAHAAAAEERQPLWRYLGGDAAHVLPVPMMNVLNGGAHADNKVDFQEFMVVPWGARSFSECLRMGAEVFHHLKKTLHDRGLGTAVGDEGGFAPDLASNEEALEVLVRGIEAAGYTPGEDIAIALDPATSEIYDERPLRARARGPQRCPSAELADYWADLAARYPIVSIEDGMDEGDWDGWATLTQRLGDEGPARRRRPVRHQLAAAQARHRPRASATRSSSRSTRSAR